MNELYAKIYAAVQDIPEGKVATYGQVAARVGNKGLARVVGNALHVNPYPGVIPCHRVVNAKGKLSGAFAFGSYDAQKRLLEAEGVPAVNLQVDLDKYGVKDDWTDAGIIIDPVRIGKENITSYHRLSDLNEKMNDRKGKKNDFQRYQL